MLVNKERTLFLLKVVMMVLVSLILLNVSTVVMAQQEDDVWITVDQTSEEIKFNEGNVSQWNTASVEEAFGGSHTISVRKDYAAEFTFEGSEIRWIGSRGPARGKADVYLDGELVAENLDTYAEEEKFNSVIFSKEVDPGTHTIEVIPTGEKNDKSLHHTIGIEGFAYLPTMDSLRNEFSKVVEDIENKLDSVSDKPGLGDKLKSFYSLEDRMELQEALVRGEVKSKNVDQDLKELSMIIDEMKKARDNFLETAQNPVFTDKTENEFNGFLEGEPVWVKGVMGNAVDLDGEDDYINSEKLPSQLGVDGKNPKTVEMWAFTRSDGGLFQMGQQAGGSDFALRNNGGPNQWLAQFWGGEFDLPFEYESEKQWVHFALVHEKDTVEVYADGQLVVSNEDDYSTGDEIPFRVGLWNVDWDFYFDGIVDDVRVWDEARTKEEIENNMNEELTGEEDNLILYWDFNDFILQ